MSTIFISSVIKGYESFRSSAKSAVELMGHDPIMSEDFAARGYSPETACLSEVEQCELYILILGPSFGYEVEAGLSVTQSEFRTANASNRTILVFIQNCEMDLKQAAFRGEVEDFHGGFFRATFDSPEKLKEEIIRALRQLEVSRQSISNIEFEKLLHDSMNNHFRNSWNRKPTLVLAFLPQPERSTDIVSVEKNTDQLFQEACNTGLFQLRDGYELLAKADYTGLKSGTGALAYFPNGLLLFFTDPTLKNSEHFENYFSPPDLIRNLAYAFGQIVNARSGFSYIGVYNFGNHYIAPPPGGNSLSMISHDREQDHFSNSFIPMTEGLYRTWIDRCVNRLSRVFGYKMG